MQSVIFKNLDIGQQKQIFMNSRKYFPPWVDFTTKYEAQSCKTLWFSFCFNIVICLRMNVLVSLKEILPGWIRKVNGSQFMPGPASLPWATICLYGQCWWPLWKAATFQMVLLLSWGGNIVYQESEQVGSQVSNHAPGFCYSCFNLTRWQEEESDMADDDSLSSVLKLTCFISSVSSSEQWRNQPDA